ncbi:MAG TPA: hypothetical protein VE136_11225, partial [Anaerolineales bacterium]|nr:hypothetical protein [Anaerolineales bacterium]
VASVTGGDILGEHPRDVFAHTLPAPRTSRPVWPELVALAAICLPLDITIRRLAISRSEVRRAFQRLLDRIEFGEASQIAGTSRAEHVEALLRAKARSQENLKPVSTAASRSGSPTQEQVASGVEGRASTRDEDKPAPGKSTAQILLDHKRRGRQQ